MSQQAARMPGVGARDRMGWLDSLRAITIVLLVAIHARVHVGAALTDDDVLNFVIETIAVPVFFLCDGFLLFHWFAMSGVPDYRTQMDRSARGVLVPWALFP
jgi:uncharacterized membrane protein YcfT